MHSTLAQFTAVSSIFDAAEIVLYVADMQTHELLFFNAYAERLWGPDWAGKRCYNVLQAGQAGPCTFCTNHQLVTEGASAPPVVWEFQNTVNKRWYLCIDKAIPWTDGRLVRMEVAIDITDRKAHEQFREHYVQLISHDLRSPLSTIIVGASGLQRVLERSCLVQAEKPLAAILRSGHRMSDMIEDLLETTRLESGHLKLNKSTFDLGALAAAVGERLGAQAGRDIRVECTAAARVLADAGRIERVLENMLGNAVRYSNAGSAIIVRTTASETEVTVAIEDRGPGIPAHEIPKLFQRFYRASGARRSESTDSADGLGLGLYSCRLIIESHGGRVWAQSEAGSGSTFAFALPAA